MRYNAVCIMACAVNVMPDMLCAVLGEEPVIKLVAAPDYRVSDGGAQKKHLRGIVLKAKVFVLQIKWILCTSYKPGGGADSTYIAEALRLTEPYKKCFSSSH